MSTRTQQHRAAGFGAALHGATGRTGSIERCTLERQQLWIHTARSSTDRLPQQQYIGRPREQLAATPNANVQRYCCRAPCSPSTGSTMGYRYHGTFGNAKRTESREVHKVPRRAISQPQHSESRRSGQVAEHVHCGQITVAEVDRFQPVAGPLNEPYQDSFVNLGQHEMTPQDWPCAHVGKQTPGAGSASQLFAGQEARHLTHEICVAEHHIGRGSHFYVACDCGAAGQGFAMTIRGHPTSP